MYLILLMTMITLANCLKPETTDTIDDETKTVISKYLDKIPDIEPQFVIHKGLSKVISQYFKGKISPLPLYKISVKLDRNPVLIPWTLSESSNLKQDPSNKLKKNMKYYRYIPKRQVE